MAFPAWFVAERIAKRYEAKGNSAAHWLAQTNLSTSDQDIINYTCSDTMNIYNVLGTDLKKKLKEKCRTDADFEFVPDPISQYCNY